MSRNHARRYAVIGAGALGAFYGARLARAGLEVHFLGRSDVSHVRQHGLRVDSVDGDILMPADDVNIYDQAGDLPECEVVLICLKATANDALRDILPRVVTPGCEVVLMQNGLNLEKQIALYAGEAARVVGGLCFICSNKVGPGHVHHLDYGRVMFGRFDPEGRRVRPDDSLKAIAADFESADIPVVLTEDLVEARWRKLVWNIPYNGLSVVLDARTDELMANRQSAQLVESLMWEVVTDCQAATGRTIPPDFVEQMLSDTRRMKPYRPSMKIDYDEKRPMEVEAIYGNPVRAAHHAGADSPLVEMLYQQLTFLDHRNRGVTP